MAAKSNMQINPCAKVPLILHGSNKNDYNLCNCKINNIFLPYDYIYFTYFYFYDANNNF